MTRAIRRVGLFLLANLILFGYIQPQSSGISYVYDELGRLIAVIDPNSDTAIYTYDAVGNLLSITRRSSSLVSIIKFTPSSGPVGTVVTIYGTGFSTTPSSNTVQFNGVTAAVTSSTATKIVTSVPTGATAGLISVTTPTGSASSSTPFTVTDGSGAPTITGFTPTIGAIGSAVTITGTNFDTTLANDKVKFNLVNAQATSATTTTIATTVPKAGSGHISVSTPKGSATSSADFYIPPSPFVPADFEVTDRMTVGGTKVVTITTANKNAMILFDGSTLQKISLKMTSVTITNSNISIYNPDGSTLTTLINMSTGGGFIDTQTLPQTGTYTILVDPTGSYTGSVTLNLYNVVDATGTITPGGPAVTVTTSTPGQNAKLTFSGSVGQRVFLKSSISNGNSCYASIQNPNGTTLDGRYRSVDCPQYGTKGQFKCGNPGYSCLILQRVIE